MTPVIAAVAASAPAPITNPIPVTPQASSAQDVDRLRALVAGVQPVGESIPPSTAVEASAEGFKTIGDSILEGVAKFNTRYHDSLKGMTEKIDRIAGDEPLELGSNFGKIMELQIEVARWTMSVMGVDNASKAGTNTVKELSKGG